MSPSRPRKIVVAVAPVSHHIDPEAPGPITPEEIADEVGRCADAGAGMVHLHVRDRRANQTEDLAVFSETLDLIKAATDIVIQGSTGGLSSLSLKERCVALNDPRVETASLNMGSVNFDEDVYINRLPDIRYWARRMKETDVLPELEVFEAGMQDFSILAAAVAMGAAVVRVGCEDSRYHAPGKAAASNAVLVEKLVSLIRQIGYDSASPEETREILGIY